MRKNNFEHLPRCPGCGASSDLIKMRARFKWFYYFITRHPMMKYRCFVCGCKWVGPTYADSEKMERPTIQPVIDKPGESVSATVTTYGWNGSERRVKQPGGGASWDAELQQWEEKKGRPLTKASEKADAGKVYGYSAGGRTIPYSLPPVGTLPHPISPVLRTNEKVNK